jgi:hypothetical protein
MDTIIIVLIVTAVIVGGMIFVKPRARPPVDPLNGPVNTFEGIDRDALAVNQGNCPDCRKSGTLLAGPSGGMSMNVACNNCLAEFNVHSGFGTGAFKVDRSGRLTEGRAAVFGIQQDEYRQIERELFSGER